MAGIGIAAVDAVAEDRHIGAALLRQHQQLVNGALEAVEHGLCHITDGIDEEDLRPHLVDRDQAACGHRLSSPDQRTRSTLCSSWRGGQATKRSSLQPRWIASLRSQ